MCLGDLMDSWVAGQRCRVDVAQPVAPRPASASKPSGPAPQLSDSCHRLQHFHQSGPNKGKTKIHFPLSESGEGEWGESHSLLCSGAHTAPYISLELKIHTEF